MSSVAGRTVHHPPAQKVPEGGGEGRGHDCPEQAGSADPTAITMKSRRRRLMSNRLYVRLDRPVYDSRLVLNLPGHTRLAWLRRHVRLDRKAVK